MTNKKLNRSISDAMDVLNECIVEIDTLEEKIIEHENYIDQLKEQISDLKSELKESRNA